MPIVATRDPRDGCGRASSRSFVDGLGRRPRDRDIRGSAVLDAVAAVDLETADAGDALILARAASRSSTRDAPCRSQCAILLQIAGG